MSAASAWNSGGAAPAGRHSLYFDLVDQFERSGCPVCRLGLAAAYRWLDSFAYEGVNDYTTREALRASKGFCTSHAWQLIVEVHDLLGAAIVYCDVIHTSLPALIEAVHRPEALVPRGVCRACTALDEAYARYLDIFQESLPDREFRRAYEAGPAALCRPHAQALLERLTERDGATAAAALLAARWQGVLEPPRAGAAAGVPRRRYRGIAGASGSFSATGFAAPEPALLKDPTVAPLELLVGRPRSATLSSGLRTMREDDVPPVPVGAEGQPPWADVCEPGACPICRLTLAEETKWLGSDDAGGSLSNDEVPALCNAHAWRLAERGHAQALRPACAAAGALATALAPPRGPRGGRFELGALFGPRTGAGQRLAARLEPAADCPLCLGRTAVESGLIDGLLADVRRPETLDVLRRAGGLCRLHFVRAMGRGAGSASAAVLARLQRERWSALRDDLLEHIRKQDYQFHEEPKGEEQTSPWRATEQVAGAREIRP